MSEGHGCHCEFPRKWEESGESIDQPTSPARVLVNELGWRAMALARLRRVRALLQGARSGVTRAALATKQARPSVS